MEDQPLTVVEGDAHIPVEPADLVAIHLEARALRLDNIDGLLSCNTTMTLESQRMVSNLPQHASRLCRYAKAETMPNWTDPCKVINYRALWRCKRVSESTCMHKQSTIESTPSVPIHC